MEIVTHLYIGSLNLDLHFNLPSLLEHQRQRELLTGFQRLVHSGQHHVVRVGLEYHLCMGGNVHDRRMLHIHHAVFGSLGVQIGLARTRRADPH